MALKGILKPEAYHDVREVWAMKKEDEALKKGIDPEDIKLTTLYHTEGWTTLKTHINNLKIGLDKRLAESVIGSLSDAQIKNDALFSVLGKELLDSIINKVEDSALLVQDIENETESTG